jgi:hypothetical protein
MESWMAMETHNGGVEAQNGALESLDQWSQIRIPFYEEQDPDPH